MSDVYKHDPYYGYEATHGEYPVPRGAFCFYEDGTLCMYAEEQEENSWCRKHNCQIISGYYKLPCCE